MIQYLNKNRHIIFGFITGIVLAILCGGVRWEFFISLVVIALAYVWSVDGGKGE